MDDLFYLPYICQTNPNHMNMKDIVVYVDDDEDDLEIFSELFSAIPNAPLLKTFWEPDKALHYLQNAESLGEVNPYVLIDVNLRTYSGFELIDKIRSIPSLENLHLALITTSQRPIEKQQAAKMGIEFIVKPTAVEDLEEIVKGIVAHCNAPK